MVGSLYPAIYGKVPRNFYDGDLNFERFRRTQGAGTYIFDHRFNTNWQFSSRGRYDYVRSNYEGVYSTGAYVGPTTISRSAFAAKDEQNAIVFDNQLRGRVVTGPVKQALTAGFDYQQMRSAELARSGRAPDLNVLAPDYWLPVTTPALFANYTVRQQQIGIYGQDELQWRGFHITGSVRNDWYRMTQKQLVSATTTHIAPSQVTWRASALSFRIRSFSLYFIFHFIPASDRACIRRRWQDDPYTQPFSGQATRRWRQIPDSRYTNSAECCRFPPHADQCHRNRRQYALGYAKRVGPFRRLRSRRPCELLA